MMLSVHLQDIKSDSHVTRQKKFMRLQNSIAIKTSNASQQDLIELQTSSCEHAPIFLSTVCCCDQLMVVFLTYAWLPNMCLTLDLLKEPS